LLQESQVRHDHFLDADHEETWIQNEGPKERLEWAVEDRKPEAEVAAEGVQSERDEVRNLRTRQADDGEIGDAGARVFSTLEQRKYGCLATRVAMSERGMPRPERKARTASGLQGDLRW
jgi:hypothetical protein